MFIKKTLLKKNSISSLIKWFPTIWKDRDWDHQFLYEILLKKLSNMENYHKNHGHTVNSKKIANQMRICTLLLNRLIKDNYNEMVFKNFYKKWGEPKFIWEKCKDNTKDLYSLKIEYDNVLTKKDKVKLSKEFTRHFKHENILRKQDVDYLFTLMKKHIQTWWD